MATPEDDRLHTPGPRALPLWNESYWFAFFDPESEIGVTARLGMHPVAGQGNLYLLIAHKGEVVHSVIDQRAAVPQLTDGHLSLHGYSIAFEQPLDRFRLTYAREAAAIDVVFEGISPTFMYAFPPGSTVEQIPRHIEHAGTVRGSITIGCTAYPIDCLGHRDHSWGGERDWAKHLRWDYLSGEIGPDFWFNAVQITLAGWPQDIYVGGLWDGKEVMGLSKIQMDVRTTDGDTRAEGVDLHITDERGRDHHIIGEEVLANAAVWFGRTSLKDGFTRYRYGDRTGYGILEHGFVEQDQRHQTNVRTPT